MSGVLEYCGQPEIHLPHEWDDPNGWRLDTNVCCGEVKTGDRPVASALHFVLAAVMVAKIDAVSGGYEDDHIESVAQYRISQAFDGLADTLRGILEPD